jgi:hypothetical protein
MTDADRAPQTFSIELAPDVIAGIEAARHEAVRRGFPLRSFEAFVAQLATTGLLLFESANDASGWQPWALSVYEASKRRAAEGGSK